MGASDVVVAAAAAATSMMIAKVISLLSFANQGVSISR